MSAILNLALGVAFIAGCACVGRLAFLAARMVCRLRASQRRDEARMDREEAECAREEAKRASDGSRYWGAKQANADAGRVVTKESGSSRERAAEALAEAAKADPDGAVTGATWTLPEILAALDNVRGAHLNAVARLNEEAAALRGALAECRRELAEARAAQAVPVPSQGTLAYDYETGRFMVAGSIWSPVSLSPPPADGTCS